MPRIISAHLERRCLPLKTPYVLSFVTLDAFETLLVHIDLDNGETRLGEVVPLPGYSSESVEDVVRTLDSWLPEFPRQELQSARQTVASQISSAPFASSLILSALDAGLMRQEQNKNCRHSVALVYPTSSSKPELEKTVKQALAAGYRTIKVKVGDNIDQDLDALPRLKRGLSPGIQVRFDANQGYTYEEARCFLAAVEAQLSENTELVEQPLPPEAWDEMAHLSGNTGIPLMLDESIYTVNDVNRAAQVGCQWIKLKLCKQGGLHELLQLAEYAKSIGLKVVIGNGVATDVSNLLELWLYDHYRHLFDGASESNGFAKLQQPVVHTMLAVESGCAVWNNEHPVVSQC